MGMADDFIESVVTASCQLAKHRKSNTLETKDLQLHLGMCRSLQCDEGYTVLVILLVLFSERAWNMTIPGFATEEQRAAPVKKSAATESHKQVMDSYGIVHTMYAYSLLKHLHC